MATHANTGTGANIVPPAIKSAPSSNHADTPKADTVDAPPIDEETEQLMRQGIAYFHGDQRFIRQNYPQAREYFEKAAAKRHPLAFYYLGTMYDEGLGMPVDEAKARLHFLRAAEMGHADSQMLTGLNFIIDGSVARTPETRHEAYRQSVEWMQKAEAQGNQEAAFWLGDMLYKGLGVKKDEKKGAALIRQSAEAGNANAMAMQAAFYWQGNMGGAEKDLMKAHEWFTRSVIGGNEQALLLRMRVENEMTPEQRQTAREKARIQEEQAQKEAENQGKTGKNPSQRLHGLINRP